MNHNVTKLSYFILETPMQIFDNISISEEIINAIEFIDYPGLDTKKAKDGDYINTDLFNKDIIQGFFFINDPKNFEDNSVKDVFKAIINKFIYKDSNVEDTNNSLFIFVLNNDKELKDFYKLDVKNLISSLMKEYEKKTMDMSDKLRIQEKINETVINLVKFSNIDYLKYMVLEEKLSSFQNFISNILENKKKKIEKNNFKSIFQKIDTYIKDIYESKEEDNNIFYSFINRFWGKSNKEKHNIEKYDLNDINSFINIFRKELIKLNMITSTYTFSEDIKNQIRTYVEKYFFLINNLKNKENYKNSFYDDFKKQILNIISSSEEIINKHLNTFIKDIVTKTKGVFQTINKKFSLGKKEFDAKYSKQKKENILENITTFYNTAINNLEKEIKKMNGQIDFALKDINCQETDPQKFDENFKFIKNHIEILIKYYDFKSFLNDYQDTVNKILEVYILDRSEKLKEKIKKIVITNYYQKC